MKVKRLELGAQDAVGGVVQSKTTVYQVSVRIRLLSANERTVGGKNGVISTHRIYCDKIAIQSKDECIVNKRVFDVNSINPGSAGKQTIEVDCTLRS